MRIVHIVSSISSVNFGVWNAAIFGSKYLDKAHHVQSEMWICTKSEKDTVKPEIPYFYFNHDQLTARGVKQWLGRFLVEDTVIVTHGAWLQPTRIGFRAKKKGFKWVYLSHGMLEPWSFQTKKNLKRIYFPLMEKRMSLKADKIRAVSEPEKSNLSKLYKTNKIVMIYNGVEKTGFDFEGTKSQPTIFLFLARLHHKKGIIHLVDAWNQMMKDETNTKLVIVGPDEGELAKIKPFFTKNTEYIGPVFGDQKEEILKSAHYYVLPSYSEGFPTSVVEAMNYGLIPIISEGCNFPEVFEKSLGYKVAPDPKSIANVLSELRDKSFDYNLAKRNREFVNKNLTEEVIGEQLNTLYTSLLKVKN